MSWSLLLGLIFVLGLALSAALSRRAELARMQQVVSDRDRAVSQGSAEAQLQHPVVDLSRCLGCGTCVAVCPEDGVLELVHGQAVVVNGARCVGVSACERECPVDAITVTISNLEERTDVPALEDDLEATGAPGVFLAGEVTAHALIKTAVDHGAAVAAEVARRLEDEPNVDDNVFDLCIVGAGPAGLSCSLEATRAGLDFVTLEQEPGVGGTVAKYPRRKLVMTRPVALPLHGKMRSTTYSKEELMELWESIVDEHELPIEHGEVFRGVDCDDDGNYTVITETSTYPARYVCLALGRRGVPRQLGVRGEDLPKVANNLIDANSYQGRRILVVGGGDSAVEAAMGLAEQPGNQIVVSYRKESFFRIKAKNEARIQECIDAGTLRVLFQSRVLAIHPASVVLAIGKKKVSLPNDDVFVMVGGIPPFELLEHAGVSFDPTLRDVPERVVERGTGATNALAIGFVLTLAVLIWALWHADYYGLDPAARSTHSKHALLRPGLGLGLWLGIIASGMIVFNLAYLLRRSMRIRFGSLKIWMTSHVATGVLALLFAMLHGAMAPGDTPGGHAFWALAVLMVTGAIGRYFYAYIPRAVNGRELELEEVKKQLSQIPADWDEDRREFGQRARDEVETLIHAQQWRTSFIGRVRGIFRMQRDLHRVLRRLAVDGREAGVPADQLRDTIALARRGHRSALAVSHFEDLRAVLNTWRYLHRWVAALLVLLVVLHILHSLNYGAFFFFRGAR